MGGLWKKIPFTFAVMTIGTLALTGFPFTAGYYSKDAIIEAAFACSQPGASYGFWLTALSAGLTSFYSWRLVFMTFFGIPRWAAAGHDETGQDRIDDHHGAHGHEGHALDPHESPLVMLIPLGVLAIGSLFAGVVFTHDFIGEGAREFWKDSLAMGSYGQLFEGMELIPFAAKQLPTILMIAGFLIALLFYILAPSLPVRLAKIAWPVYEFLLNKWYFDELYDLIFVRPAFALGRLFWKGGDGAIIDRLGPDGVAARVVDVMGWAVRLQSGYIYRYAGAMVIGLALVISWYMARGLR
jgi:NADH-quinone oxidoreductase subunit L